MAEKLNRLVYEIEVNEKGKAKVKNLTKGFIELDNALNRVTADVKKQQAAMVQTTTKGLNPMIDKTGLAGATVTELGRTISDANYGIRGMANNLQQLSSLFVTLIATSGGLANGLRALGKVLMGPLGFIIIFQTLITLLEGGKLSMGLFSAEVRKLNSALTDGAKAVGGEVGELKSLIDIAKDETISRKDRQDALDKAIKTYPEYLKNITLENIETEKSSKAIERQIELLIARAKVQELTNLIIKESEKIFEAQANIQNKSAEQYASFGDFAMAFIKGFGNAQSSAAELTKNALNSQNKTVQKSSEIISMAQDEIKKILRNTPKVYDTINESTKNSVDKLAALLSKYRQKLKESEAISRAEILKVQRDAVLRQARFLGATIEQLAPIIAYFNNEIRKAQETEIKKQIKENKKVRLEAIKQELKDVMGVLKASQETLGYMRDVFISYSNERIEALKRERDYILNSGKLTGAAQKKALEDLEKRERKAQERKIKLERDLFTIKQTLLIAEEIAKAKATAKQIALDAARSVGAANMSIGAFVNALGPYGTAAFAITIGGIIASIVAARKKAQSAIAALGGSSSSSGGGGVGVEAPDFNVVGASPESQLAQSVSEQQTKPLRAFVVHNDIKDADELSRKVDFNRSLG
jgi:DNA repair exonuclease SbcCD ATPase subunit